MTRKDEGIRKYMKPKKDINEKYNNLIWSDNDQKAKTPPEVWHSIHEEFGKYIFDPCPPNPKWDGLKISWKKLNYVNPPYNKCKDWMKKAVHEMKVNKCKSVCLIPCRSHTNWFHEYVIPYAAEIRFIKNGVRFVGYKRKSPFSTCIVIYDPKHEGIPVLNSIDFYEKKDIEKPKPKPKPKKRKAKEEKTKKTKKTKTKKDKIDLPLAYTTSLL